MQRHQFPGQKARNQNKIIDSDDNEANRETRSTTAHDRSSRGASGLLKQINVDRIINENFDNEDENS